MGYQEISLQDAWEMLAAEPTAELIDVRTMAEWNYVGLPDLTAIGKRVRAVEWISFPDGAPNPDFTAQATDGLTVDQPVLLLCRSGARSRAAAEALESVGFSRTYNVTAGFEGDLDPAGHRHGGWKEQLPWKQS